MAHADPEQTPADAEQSPTPVPPAGRRRLARFGWLGVLIPVAALGLVLGYNLVARGQSLGAHGPSGATSRPTFVIGAAVSPVPRGSPSPIARASAVAAEYVVEPGDTLRSIAEHAYGDATQWPRIYDANRDVIGSNPDALYAGMRLRIP